MHKLVLLLILLLTFSSCDFQKREKELENKELELNQKEQALNLKEHSLLIREEKLNEKELKLDSSAITFDTLSGLYPNLTGKWSVKMICSETTCPGSAIGDTKTETWDITIQNNAIIAAASNNGKLSRIYSGSVQLDRLELISENTDQETQQKVKMIVRLKQTKEGTLTGTRDIIRTEDCHILYDLELKKQEKN